MAIDTVYSAQPDVSTAAGERLGLLAALVQESLRAAWVAIDAPGLPEIVVGTRSDEGETIGRSDKVGTIEMTAAVRDREWSDRESALLNQFARLASNLVADEPATVPAAAETPAPRMDADHEIRSGLQEIIGFTEFLKRETRPDIVAAHASTIQSAAEALLLQFRRGTAERIVEPPTTDELADVESAHILLADDLDLNRKLICDMLSLEGHVVDSVADGASAVKAACERRYDLILMDMIMPGMDGVAATRAIRALPSPACDVPIVALTAHSLPEQLDSCLEAGMDATLTKPMSMDALTGAVATWTRRRRKAA